MDCRINSLKENQQLLGSKITMLQETNKKKDEEAEKIRQLIAECRENLNRIKCDAKSSSSTPDSKGKPKMPCGAKSKTSQDPRSRCDSNRLTPCGPRQESPSARYRNFSQSQPNEDWRKSCPGNKNEDPCAKYRAGGSPSQPEDPCAKYRPGGSSSQPEDPCAKYRPGGSSSQPEDPCAKYRPGGSSSQPEDPCAKYRMSRGATQQEDPCAKFRTSRSEPQQEDPCANILESIRKGTTKDPCESATAQISSKLSALADAKNKSRRCIDKIGERMEREVKMKIISGNACECHGAKLFNTDECEDEDNQMYRERVSCRVDLSKMKVNIRGPPEDLKKLDAVQLINLLDKFQCQELVIHTGGNENQSEFREVPVFYLTHLGNLVLIVGIVMVAFLINANLCSPDLASSSRLLLNMLYLGSFAFHYGIVLWMSFTRGLTLSAGLSREAFNAVDNLILPKYFALCVFLSATSLYSFLAAHCPAPCTSWPLPILVQIIIVSMTFLIELVAVCYIVPAIIKLRAVIEEFTEGEEEEDDDCPPPEGYCKNVEKLSKLNWTISIINTITVMFMGSNLYYISSNLNIG